MITLTSDGVVAFYVSALTVGVLVGLFATLLAYIGRR